MRRRSTFFDVARALVKQPAGQVGVLITLVLVGGAIAAPILHLHGPLTADPTNLLAPPAR